jgi:hypothetical protein
MQIEPAEQRELLLPTPPWDAQQGLLPRWRHYFPRRYFPGGGAQKVYTWPTADPAGPLLTPLTKLAELLAACPTFRVKAGLAADDPDADAKLLEGAYGSKKRIHFPAVDLEQHTLDPGIVLSWGPEWNWETDAGGDRHHLKASGDLWMAIHDKERYPGDHQTAARDFGIFVGNLIAELASQFGYDDCLTGDRIRQAPLDAGDDGSPRFSPLFDGAARDQYTWSAFYFVHWS